MTGAGPGRSVDALGRRVTASVARRRERALAGDRRAGSFSGRQALRRRYEFIRRAWYLVLALPLAALAASPLVWLLPHWLRGFALGVILSSGVWSAAYLVATTSGAAMAAMGQLAEQWTAQDLRRLTKRDWHLANSLAYRRWDLDHVVVGPGGVLVVETKYSANGWSRGRYTDGVVQLAVDRVAQGARDVWLTSGKSILPRHLVRPVVVLWGGDYEQQEGVKDDVLVLPGPKLQGWLEALPDDGLTPGAVQMIYAGMDAHIGKRDEADRELLGRPPRPMFHWMALAAGVLPVAVAGYLLEVTVLRAIGWRFFPPVGLAFAAAAWHTRRYRVPLSCRVAWLVGSQAVSAILLVGYVASWLQRLSR